MKIKKIEIQGFKSFVDRVEMKFPSGIITVVGPNGCGKSNVVDALRWAMGEQSAKHLRGKLMEDIIFNGSETRKPVGMAEVSITFDNADGNAPADFADYSEITVSRRLFRSGESEYQINKAPCRLKDITELFMDTGVGTKAYSIVEQGKIGAIVTMKPEDRRSLIEEAAGITKYKSKKTAALRKVDATQQNLLRVKDVIREVRRQINSLERQAKKAERYKTIRDEIRALELSISALAYGNLSKSLAEKKACLKDSIDSETKLSAQIASGDKASEESRLDSLKAEEALREEQERAHKASNQIVEFEQKISFSERELERLEGEGKRYTEEVVRLKKRLRELETKLATLKEELELLSAKEKDEAATIEKAEKEYRQQYEAFTGQERALGKLKNEVVHIATMKSNLNNSITHLKERIEDLKRRLSRKAEERVQASDALVKAQARAKDLDARLNTLYSDKSTLDGSKSTEIRKLTSLRDEREEKEKVLNSLQEQIHRSASKQHSLKELKHSYEGVQAGVQSVMQRHEKGPLTDGVLGIVVDFLDVPEAYETAVGAALDRTLQYVVVKDRKSVIEAVDHLKKNKAGRGTFAVQKMLKTKGFATAWTGSGTPLASKLGAKEGFEELKKTLLGDILLVSDINEGLGQWDSGFSGTIVTMEGEIIGADGCITGGNGEKGGFDILKREREIKELTSSLKKYEDTYKKVSAEKTSINDRIVAAEKELDDLKRREFEKNIAISNLEKDKLNTEQDASREEERNKIIIMEEEQLLSEKSDFITEIETSEKKLIEHDLQKETFEGEIRQAEETRSTTSEALEEARQRLTELRITGASFSEKRQNLEREFEAIQNDQTETLRLLDRDERALLEGRERAKETSTALSSAQSSLKNLLESHLSLNASLTDKKNRYNTITEAIRKVEAELKELHHSYDKSSRQTSQLKVAVTEREMELKHLCEGILEKHNIDLKTEGDTLGLPQDGDTERLEKLNSSIAEIGEVNLTALDEHRENVERLDFLETQEKDLLEAIDSLKRTISRINTTSRKRFKEAFDEINKKFKEVFPSLFHGGRAELLLTDENDLLETGVEIIAQPPGKKLQNMNLLSGGEKALTAISLIFSIFLVKPSPFCLLDEVDAPLDDANVGRFNNLVKEMSKVSQIIMITHNKHSIQIGDTLYGVTMEDPGVSKFVSVKLN